jgi:hypothetical protein
MKYKNYVIKIVINLGWLIYVEIYSLIKILMNIKISSIIFHKITSLLIIVAIWITIIKVSDIKGF